MKNRNVVLMLMLMCAVLSSPLFAQPTPGDVEALVTSVSTTYLDFVANGVGYTRGGITCTTNASNWGYPDGSDSDIFVNGDCYDSKNNSETDFTATITGLAAGATYDIYIKQMHDGDKYGYKWGLASASENLINPTDATTGIYVAGDGEGGKGSYLWLLREETFAADGAGQIVLYFGKNGGRTQYDGVLLALQDMTINPAPIVDAGPDQSVYDPEGLPVQLAGSATDAGPADGTSPGTPGGVVSSYWYQLSGPGTATFTPAGGIDELAPTVTFSDTGVYELVLQATDIEPKDGNDIVVITVKDHADDFLVGHWPLDGDALDASMNSNDGTLEGQPGGMPTYSADAAVGTNSIDVTDYLGLQAVDDHDPNQPHVDLGPAPELNFGATDWTVSAWFKSTQVKGSSGDIGKAAIFGNGADYTPGTRYCLLLGETSSGRVDFVTDQDSTDTKRILQTDGGNLLNDDMWHFVVGMRAGNELRLYRDGILDDTDTVPADYDLSDASGWNSYIGMISDARGGIFKHYDGLIDDVRVYNYALPLEDATYLDVLELTAMGELAADCDAGSDASYQLQPGESVQTAGTVIDNGIPGTLNLKWTTVSGPADSNAVFVDDTALVTDVTFPEFGVYVLQLAVEDVNLGIITDTSEVTLTIISPNCADVEAAGLLLPGDISGPDGTPDCRVDLNDVAAFIADFMRCNDPQAAECEDPWSGL
ncbi:MAG: LamG domain-containing protein [Planctomycetes bacterium]|nr:LamG domain-containing protein [Planctomycetota bacterium]